MAIHCQRSSPFEENRCRIEDFIYGTIIKLQNDLDAAIRGVDKFANALDKFVDTIEQMYQTPGLNDTDREKSSPIGDGRYRVFYKIAVRSNKDFDITLLDIDDNGNYHFDIVGPIG